VTDQHFGKLLKRLQPLPLKLIDPSLQMVHHRACVAIPPQPVQALLKEIGLNALRFNVNYWLSS
jgi:hypothetical protein